MRASDGIIRSSCARMASQSYSKWTGMGRPFYTLVLISHWIWAIPEKHMPLRTGGNL